jgi:hypothetical protein
MLLHISLVNPQIWRRLVYGYLESMVQRNPRYSDAEFPRFLRRYQ